MIKIYLFSYYQVHDKPRKERHTTYGSMNPCYVSRLEKTHMWSLVEWAYEVTIYLLSKTNSPSNSQSTHQCEYTAFMFNVDCLNMDSKQQSSMFEQNYCTYTNWLMNATVFMFCATSSTWSCFFSCCPGPNTIFTYCYPKTGILIYSWADHYQISNTNTLQL